MGAPWRDHPSWDLVNHLSQVVDRDLSHLLLDAGPDDLKATRNAQLAAFTLSLVALDAALNGPLKGALDGSGAEPGANYARDDDAEVQAHKALAVAGHSLGEYTALVAAGALGRAEGALLVQARAEAMQAAADANPGTMAAVLGLDVPQVAQACLAAGRSWVANDNSPGQVVVAGEHPAVATAGHEALARGAKRVVPLQVGGAFHSPLMAPAQAPLDASLARAGFAPVRVPVVANVDALPHDHGFAQLLSAQLCSQVRWRESLLALSALGTTLFVELGPGTELSGMVKRTVPGAQRANVAGPEDLESLASALQAAF
jgi:[acyl-carrier-protein] S-malonyltransferase